MKTQLERLQEILKTNNHNYKMKDIFMVFSMSMQGYEKASKTVKSIKKKITKEEWNSLINGITATVFISLHAYKLPLNEALELGHTQGIMGVGIVSSKKKKTKAKKQKKDGKK